MFLKISKLFFNKETPTQEFSWEYCEIFKNTNFEEHLGTVASEVYNELNNWMPHGFCCIFAFKEILNEKFDIFHTMLGLSFVDIDSIVQYFHSDFSKWF